MLSFLIKFQVRKKIAYIYHAVGFPYVLQAVRHPIKAPILGGISPQRCHPVGPQGAPNLGIWLPFHLEHLQYNRKKFVTKLCTRFTITPIF